MVHPFLTSNALFFLVRLGVSQIRNFSMSSAFYPPEKRLGVADVAPIYNELRKEGARDMTESEINGFLRMLDPEGKETVPVNREKGDKFKSIRISWLS